MVLINDNFEFEVRTWDTTQSIVNRLAARMNTLPIYLYFPHPIEETLQSYLKIEEDVVIGDIGPRDPRRPDDLLTSQGGPQPG